MTKPLALIVDDEPDIRELLEITLARMNIDARSADCLESAHAWLRKEKFQLCLTDMNLPDGSGISLVQTIQREYPHIPVAVISRPGTWGYVALDGLHQADPAAIRHVHVRQAERNFSVRSQAWALPSASGRAVAPGCSSNSRISGSS